MIDSSSSSHPTDEAVAAYLEAVLPASERTLLERHVEDCEYCRARLVLAGRSLQTSPRPISEARWVRRSLVGLAAAAALAGVLLLSRSAVQPADPALEVRAAEMEEATPVRVLTPLRNADVESADLRFIWSAIAPDVLYQVTLSAPDGQILWSQRTGDTITSPPPEVRGRLESGQRYFWRVDALLSNLRSVSSGDLPFEVTE